jgi:hypothetical protein
MNPIQRRARRLEKAITIGELALKRLNEDRNCPKRVRQAVRAMFLCDLAMHGKLPENSQDQA